MFRKNIAAAVCAAVRVAPIEGTMVTLTGPWRHANDSPGPVLPGTEVVT